MTNLLGYLVNMLYAVPVLLIAFPVHEFSHAAVAYGLGDNTAKLEGRLTLNPFKHLDPLGTICLILTNFGWAKPVPVNPRNFRKPREGMALTALAGPFSNFLLGFVSVFLYDRLQRWFPGIPDWLLTFFYMAAVINTGLTVFNLIPVAPLDGSRILAFFLPPSVEETFYRYGVYIQLGILLLLFTGVLSGPLDYMVGNLLHNFSYLVSLLP
jgi:Zn-dependent protease